VGNARFSVRARKDSLPAAMDLLTQILREPALDAAELATMKPALLASAEESRTDPSRLASILLERTQSPYPAGDVRESLTPDEQIAKLKAVTIEQVRQLYQEYLGATAGELTIIGDFDPEPTIRKLNEMLDDWKPAKPYARIERQAFVNVKGGRQSILTPDKANANYEAGIDIAMNDQHPDYAALLLGNYILGGGSLSSRLGDRVRQKEGLSYGVSSGFFAGAEDNVAGISMNAISNPSNVGKVETAIREEFEKLLKDGIPAEEFAKARAALLLSRQRQRNEEFYLASRLDRSLRVDQTLAYDAGIDEKLAALTPDDVQAALKKHFDPTRLVVVVAGDFKQAQE
jgi:zinc protease